MGAPPAGSSRAQQFEDEEALPTYTLEPEPSELPAYDEAAGSSTSVPPPPDTKAAPPPPQPLRSMLDVDDGPSGRFLPEDVLPPAIYVLDDTVIYASADSERKPLYKLDWNLTGRLGPRAHWIEFSRMEPKVADPTQHKPRHIYNLNHCSAYTGPPLTEAGATAATALVSFYFVQPTAGPSRRMGCLGFKRESDHWTALPFGIDEQTGVVLPPSKYTAAGGAPLWEARKVQGAACKWVEARPQGDNRPAGDVAMEYDAGSGTAGGRESEPPRLVVTATLTRQKRDALIALWCLRQWATRHQTSAASPPVKEKSESRWKSNSLRWQLGILPTAKKPE
ncbi:hypothetical protein Sste5346_007319 [Sporothrix stenoceras]|uniref:Uncharacterized protein n=1 Tax=Sporothrix stenoceras TaxID=5173 RepID=A0ABR3YVW6_9PEZI